MHPWQSARDKFDNILLPKLEKHGKVIGAKAFKGDETSQKIIHTYTERLSVPMVSFLGAFVSAVELPCTGAPYLAIITLLSQNFDFFAFLLLVLYNFIFVLPLIIILILVAFGMGIHRIKEWKQGARGYMRLFIGLMLVGLGWLLIMIANGTINLN